jgi:hypothetical protein
LSDLKICKQCDKELPLDSFGTYVSRGTEYTRTVCKECRSENARNQRDDHTRYLERQQYKRKKENNPEATSDYYRDWHLRRKYGITLEEFNALSEEQGHLCAICGKSNTLHGKLVVDHNHNTGEVRGLICSPCNSALGHAQDSVNVLEKMIDYLNERGSYGD